MLKWTKGTYGLEATITHTDKSFMGNETLTITKKLRIVKEDDGLFYLLIAKTVQDAEGRVLKMDGKYNRALHCGNGDKLKYVKEDIQRAIDAQEYASIR